MISITSERYCNFTLYKQERFSKLREHKRLVRAAHLAVTLRVSVAVILGLHLEYPDLGLVAGYLLVPLLLPERVVAVPVHPDLAYLGLGAGELLALLL